MGAVGAVGCDFGRMATAHTAYPTFRFVQHISLSPWIGVIKRKVRSSELGETRVSCAHVPKYIRVLPRRSRDVGSCVCWKEKGLG